MAEVRLRPVRANDLAALSVNAQADADPFNFFGFRADNTLERRFATDGMVSEDGGTLAVETTDGRLIGDVSWHAVQHGPTRVCRAFNIGIALLPAERGRGYGTAAHAALADHLFRTTLVERIEATTDVENLPEQRALEKAGFQREGVLRHAQFRAGVWHDAVQYSRLRHDQPPVAPYSGLR